MPSAASPPPRATYTHGYDRSVLAAHRWRTAENSAGYLLPFLAPGQRLLDLGCGVGTLTADLSARVAPGPVVALDLAAEVLAEAQRSIADAAGTGPVAFALADGLRLPFPDDSFDVVHAHQVLQHVADPVAVLAELRRVCRPGGLVAARDSDYLVELCSPADPRLARWRDLYVAVARRNGGEPAAGRYLVTWAERAGFGEIRASVSTWAFVTPEERRWWGETRAERTLASDLARHARAGGLAEPTELEDLAQAWRDWAHAPAGWCQLTHGEILCRP
ncbi:class I SAM-dependent methyltransferase [Aciditerrimonas ferrireducens]|uniref:Class I SAM-dependent methyltransferase n=1 Tax=Aciditerrimonas ferrireducens TaxID=667306 RepID=A0ABV6C1Z6_9ACTN